MPILVNKALTYRMPQIDDWSRLHGIVFIISNGYAPT